jgi:DHA2 family multidrug resistance protein
VSGAAAAASAHAWRPRANPWAIAIVVTLAAFMEILDSTIVNVALPHIAGSMSASTEESTWTLTSYLVANGIVLPISAWLGRLLGRRRYFLISIAAFTLFSFLCGIAQNLSELIVFRLLQGFFGGGLQPNQQSIIMDTFPPARRGAALSVVAIAVVIAPVLGPTLGGIITDDFSWRWIFLINIPVGAACFLGVAALVEDPPWMQRSAQHFDAIGLALIALAIGCLQVVLDRGEQDDWFGSSFISTFAVFSVIGFVGAVAWLLTAKQPIVNLRVLADRNLAVGCLMVSATMAVLYSSAVLIPLLTQTVLGYTSTLAGYVLSPGALVLLCLIPIVGRLLLPRVQTRLLVFVGFVLLGVSLLYSRLLTPDIDFATLVKIRIAQTIGLAFLFVPISAISYATLRPEQRADATALNVMFRNIAGSIGIGVATALLTSRGQVHQAHLARHLTPLDPAYVQLLDHNVHRLIGMGHAAQNATGMAMGMIYRTLQTQATVLAYSDVFLAAAMMAFVAAPFALLFSGAKGAMRAGGH